MPIRISEAPRGVLAGIKKDAELAKQARLTGEETRAHGVAWSHGYLNQKPWHPLSYRNQRDLFMAEEKTAKAAETNKQAQFEFEREQEFFRNAELMGDRERERVTNRQSVSFMYQVRDN
jgi:CBF1 interacting corepressor